MPKERKPAKAAKKPPTTKRTSREERIMTIVARAPLVSLEEHLRKITDHESSALLLATQEQVGACLVRDPHTGQPSCLGVPKDTGRGLKGTFIGGPCGG